MRNNQAGDNILSHLKLVRVDHIPPSHNPSLGTDTCNATGSSHSKCKNWGEAHQIHKPTWRKLCWSWVLVVAAASVGSFEKSTLVVDGAPPLHGRSIVLSRPR